jgi:hypothetical protein
VEKIYLYWTAKETLHIIKVSTNFILITINFINQYRKGKIWYYYTVGVWTSFSCIPSAWIKTIPIHLLNYKNSYRLICLGKNEASWTFRNMTYWYMIAWQFPRQKLIVLWWLSLGWTCSVWHLIFVPTQCTKIKTELKLTVLQIKIIEGLFFKKKTKNMHILESLISWLYLSIKFRTKIWKYCRWPLYYYC